VALFGLAFKHGTDDLRESPYVLLAEKLIGKGFDVRIFDRSVQVARLVGSNRAYIEQEIPHLERLMVNEPVAALERAGMAVVGHLGREDRAGVAAAIGERRLLDLAGVPEFRGLPGYQGFCW
jgi:GDP-mannose 6-dehydrogenase